MGGAGPAGVTDSIVPILLLALASPARSAMEREEEAALTENPRETDDDALTLDEKDSF